MIYTIEIDESTQGGKMILNQILKNKNIKIRSTAQPSDCTPPEGFMTLEEFRKKALLSVEKLCDKYGIS